MTDVALGQVVWGVVPASNAGVVICTHCGGLPPICSVGPIALKPAWSVIQGTLTQIITSLDGNGAQVTTYQIDNGSISDAVFTSASDAGRAAGAKQVDWLGPLGAWCAALVSTSTAPAGS